MVKGLKRAAKSGKALPDINFDNSVIIACSRDMKAVVGDFKHFAKMFKASLNIN